MIQIIGRFQVKESGKELYKNALIEGRIGTPSEPKNHGIRLFEDKQRSDFFIGYLKFEDMKAVGYHRAQPYELKLIELSKTELAVPQEAFVLGEAIDGEKIVDKNQVVEDQELYVTALFDFKPGQRDKVIEQYQKQIPNVRAQDGCISFNVYPVLDNQNQLVVLEWWKTPEIARNFSLSDNLSMETGKILAESLDQPIPEYLHELREL